MSILVTSTDRLSRHVISTLLSLPDCPPIRVIAQSDANVEGTFPTQLRYMPHSIVVAETFQGREFGAIFRGISVVFHNGPTTQPYEECQSLAIIDAAKGAGVKHFILCSVLQPMRVKLQSHRIKLKSASTIH
jgi:hypothetical protein